MSNFLQIGSVLKHLQQQVELLKGRLDRLTIGSVLRNDTPTDRIAVGDGAEKPAVVVTGYGSISGTGHLVLRSARGTPDAPTAVTVGDVCGEILFEGYAETAFKSFAAIIALPRESFLDAEHGGDIWFYTAPVDGTALTKRLGIPSTGGITIPEISSGTTPPTNELLLYSKDRDGTSAPYVKGDDGKERPLNRGIAVKATASGSQSINDSSATALNWSGTDEYDTDGMHDPASNSSRITCTIAGKYRISATIHFAANTTGIRQMWFNNGTGIYWSYLNQQATQAEEHGMHNSIVLDMAVGDYVQVIVQQKSGGALNVNSNASFLAYFAAECIG